MSERAKLIWARERLGLTRAELAEKIGLTRHYVFVVETGARNPSLDVMTRWADALGPRVTLDLFRSPAAANADAAE